jgi:catechol 2,3-dioxygenase-like lactoylglutathione lyase family enzyme
MTKSYTRYRDDDVFRPEHFSGWFHHGALNRNIDVTVQHDQVNQKNQAWNTGETHTRIVATIHRMSRILIPALSALAVLLLPICHAQQAASTPANAASTKEAAPTPGERGRILGIGGIFFKSTNQQQMREWYGKHLGLADKGEGVMLPWREKDNPDKEHVTVWTVFPGNTKYFEPNQAFMVDYIVDDLDALLERLQKEGVKIDPKRQDADFGRFAWIYDPDGNKIELWQPLTPKKK